MKTPVRKPLCWAASAAAASCLVPWAAAQAPDGAPSGTAPAVAQEAPAAGVLDWLRRMHTAASRNSYIGTFVVSAGSGNLWSARIWHACEGELQLERVEALTGPPRTTFRRNEQVLTFLPEQRVVKSERRDNVDLFPGVPGAPDSALATLYSTKVLGKGRVAGFDTDVVQLSPQDDLRFGYRIWTEKQTGLLTKLQTVDADGRVLEQSAFSELQLHAPVKVQALSQMMSSTAGYKLEKAGGERTTAQAEGWTLKQAVPGFKPVSCYRRSFGGSEARTLQWTFSDGLASVSLFVEPFDPQRQSQETLMALGATTTLTRRISDGSQEWWLTAVGEVPARTLEAFARNLARVPR